MVRRRVLQAAVAELNRLILLVYALHGVLWVGTVTVSLFISKSLISLRFTSRQDGGLLSSTTLNSHMLIVTVLSRTCLLSINGTEAACHRSLAHVCSG